MRNAFLSICLVICVSCNNDVSNNLDVFNPEYSVTLRELKNDGFTWLPSDEIMYSKTFGDTLLYYYFDHGAVKNSKPVFRYCVIPFKHMHKDSIELYLYLRNCFIVSEVRKGSSFQQFFIRNVKNNLLFECTTNSLDSTMTLSYGYPLLDWSPHR